MKQFLRLVVPGFLAGLASCVQPPEYPDEPAILFESMSTDRVARFGNDTVVVVVSFTDGDGDLGHGDQSDNIEDPADTVLNVFMVDSRLPGFPISFHIDSVPRQSNVPAISGTIELELNPFVMAWDCLNGLSEDTAVLSIRMIDRAGNSSNTVRTPPIFIDCP